MIMKYFLLLHLLISLCVVPLLTATASDDAWDAVKTYQYGDDFQPLLAVEAEVMRSVESPETKAQTAARLAALLDDGTTFAGRQFICMQLRLVGGAAEVPLLAKWLNRSEDAENARLALADIPCEESLVPLRQALDTSQGRALIGVIGSLAARNDRASVPAFVRLLDDSDREVASAAASALERFGAEGLDALLQTKDSPAVATALIGVANKLVDQGNAEEAAKLFSALADADCPVGLRRAAFQGQLRVLSPEQRKQTIAEWFFEDDSAKNDIAAFHLTELPDAVFDELYANIGKMSVRSRIVFFETAAERKGEQLLESLLETLESSDASERLTALRMIGKLGDASTIPVLIAALAKDEASQDTAREALIRFPVPTVGPQLLDALRQPAARNSAIDVIVAMKYYDAIDPMIRIVRNETDADSVIVGLGRLCDPDDIDLPRLLELYFACRPATKREKVERAIVVVCEKEPDPVVRADKLMAILERRNGGLSEQVLIDALPLLGKVGNPRVAEMIQPLLHGQDPVLQQAAIRALCNWPNADFLDDLWKIASEHPSTQYRQWALRAFIRVATLKSDRPESETLAMLKNAMSIAVNASDRQWCLSRAATIRTMESADWAASFLDDPVLSQTACTVIVELAHHRFLREPNKAGFEPVLLKVEQTAKDKDIVDRARKSRLGM